MRSAIRDRAYTMVRGEGYVKATSSPGMQTIHVRGDISQAIAELDAVLEETGAHNSVPGD